jgi:hypothetical protein
MAANQAIVERALEAIRALDRKDGGSGPSGESRTEPRPAANVTAPAETPAPNPLSRCGSPTCGGCYSVGESNGPEQFIHPPKSSPDWLEWRAKWDLAKWRPPKGSRTQ